MWEIVLNERYSPKNKSLQNRKENASFCASEKSRKYATYACSNGPVFRRYKTCSFSGLQKPFSLIKWTKNSLPPCFVGCLIFDIAERLLSHGEFVFFSLLPPIRNTRSSSQNACLIFYRAQNFLPRWKCIYICWGKYTPCIPLCILPFWKRKSVASISILSLKSNYFRLWRNFFISCLILAFAKLKKRSLSNFIMKYYYICEQGKYCLCVRRWMKSSVR